jgi:hypothetical protein
MCARGMPGGKRPIRGPLLVVLLGCESLVHPSAIGINQYVADSSIRRLQTVGFRHLSVLPGTKAFCCVRSTCGNRQLEQAAGEAEEAAGAWRSASADKGCQAMMYESWYALITQCILTRKTLRTRDVPPQCSATSMCMAHFLNPGSSLFASTSGISQHYAHG